ncbi:MAG: GntR family transcriptional regulator [Roseibium album]|uniref:HTH-type transcriptional regulator McbR n=1 Tax=Roseibium album TaxID=311410 RepID=A0A0M7AXJ4_9HYPH|nr:GntR family transcriptional regulator [Roseibium album]MBG6147983.1 DNA-binding GntR family transcriptional regulator [Labrenzia sp. EL_142]MBG6154527.1 DNA-binding GntR family transcriptional regulator [Labrenzia sp. EL_162]MBG6161804.1 DNA-binding GntR family transcriptional regulator [Labrenzia sp. EL_195]MBG6193343.1 DNA-binding GntR family transcriptional regulator [Labrenzia sp. EL_159]MBG6199710.1 DNA-binding GntR family transcriptional regulator [Labrenzia sp. EL_13]MBG6210064.1 DN
MEQRRADNIAEALEEHIFSGSFQDGDRLDEVRLAEQFGVSRTPLREAFQRLALSGLVELVPRRGAFVRQPGPIELMEMFEVMAELEAVCGRLAAMRISEEALDDLRDANAKCQKAVDARDTDGYYTENERFHKTIYRQSGNRFLEQEAAKLHKRLKPFRRQQLKFRGRMAQSMAEHEAIVDALATGKPEESANALRNHVAVQGEKFHNLMASLKSKAE